MAYDDRIFKNRHPQLKYGVQTQSEDQLQIKFLEMGEERSISPKELEYKELWANESCKIILVELFHQSLDHNELLEKFSEKMTIRQRQRANEISMRDRVDPMQVIRSEEFTKFNPYNPESTLYKYIMKLKGYGLIKQVAHTLSTHNIFYSLTLQGKKRVVTWISQDFQGENILFLTLLNYYTSQVEKNDIHNIHMFSLPAMYILMKWLEQTDDEVDQLLVCFNKPLSFQSIIQTYQEYLLLIEREDPHELKNKLKKIDIETRQKLQSLSDRGFISYYPSESLYDLTQKGMDEFSTIYAKFRSILVNLEEYQLIIVTTHPQAQDDISRATISLTNNGRIIGEQIRDTISTDENIIMNPIDDVDFHDEFLLPIVDEMERLKDMQQEARKIDIIIPKRKKKGLRYQFMDKITHPFVISFFLMAGIMLVWFSATSNFESKFMIGLAIASFIIAPIIMLIRDRWRILDQQQRYDQATKERLL